MQPRLTFITLGVSVVLGGCGSTSPTTNPPRYLHVMGQFTVGAGEEFLKALAGHDTIEKLSIIDCRRTEYKVNARWIFDDTLQREHPNLVNYATFAREFGMEPEAMLNLIRSFDAMKVNEFRRMQGYHFLQVAVGFTRDRGYVHILDPAHSVGGTLPYFSGGLQLMRDLGNGWYEVQGI